MAISTFPWYCDTFWSHFKGRGFDATEGGTNTTLAAPAAADATSLTLTSAVGFIVGQVIVVGSGTTWQSFTVDAIVGAVLTVYPKVQTGGLGSGSIVNHAWGNDTHPSFTMSYAAYAQTLSDMKQRRALVGRDLLGTVGLLASTYTDARAVANVPVGWESLSTLTATLTSYSTADRLPDARDGFGCRLLAGAVGAGIRTLAAISVTPGTSLVVTAMAKHIAGTGFTMSAVDKSSPSTVLGSLAQVFGHRDNFNHNSLAQVGFGFRVPAGVTNIEIRITATGGSDECVLDDVRLLVDRQAAEGDRYLFEDPGSDTVAWLGDSWGVGASGAAEQFRTALETRLGHSVAWLNAAVSGNTLADMVARFDADIKPTRPKYLIIQYGANDLIAARTEAGVVADAELIVAKCRSLGTIPVFTGMPPIQTVIANSQARSEAVRARLSAATESSMSNFHQETLGSPFPMSVNAVTFTSYAFLNTTDTIEWIFQVPDDNDAATITITQLGYRLTSVAGTSPLMRISLQGMGTDGNPDGTTKNAGASSATFTPAGSATWNWVTLGTPYVASRGEFLAIVISYVSGTLNVGNAPTIAHTFGGGASEGFPYAIQNVSPPTPGRVRQVQRPVFGFRSASKAFGLPVQTLTATTFSTTAERALRFLVEGGLATAFKVGGIRMLLLSPVAGKTLDVNLYDGTTVIATAVWDSDAVRTNGANTIVTLWFQDAVLPTLLAGQEYRISLAPRDASTNVAWYTADFIQASDMEVMPQGANFYLSTRATGGATAWTDTLTSRPVAELIVSQWIEPVIGPGRLTGGLQ